MKKIIFAITALLVLGLILENMVYTKRANNYVREGAGPYYNLVTILPEGVKLNILDDGEKWKLIETDGAVRGWIAANSLSDKKANTNLTSKLADLWSSSKVSKVSLAGAVKGLTGKLGSVGEGDVNQFFRLIRNEVTESEAQGFVNLIDLYSSENRDEVDFDDIGVEIKEYDPVLEEQQIGLGIASRLAAKGVHPNTNVKKYIDLVSRALLIKSNFYDFEFHTLLLNQEQADGFACPGGYIFITKGAYLVCEDESELAAIIAHELSHVLLKHGMKEMKERAVHIKSDDMFAELDEETDDEFGNETADELDGMMANMYEKVVGYRTLEYETEADKAASILLANAGYDPWGIVRITNKLALLHKQEKDIFHDNYLSPNEVQKRFELIKSFVNDNYEKENPGGTFKSRFNKYYDQLK
ncbi:MAG: M48 family metallopeptidase [Bacteroidota bacterium]